jgi:glucose-1-phosphate cytidylyltransferase
VGDINIKRLVEFHKKHKKILTITSVQPEGRFGALDIGDDNKVLEFKEKPKGDGGWINAGFFVCESGVFDYIKGDETIFEDEPLKKLTKDGQLYTYKHTGFWKPMDTLRDKRELNRLWNSGKAPWKMWE